MCVVAGIPSHEYIMSPHDPWWLSEELPKRKNFVETNDEIVNCAGYIQYKRVRARVIPSGIPDGWT